MITLEDMEDLSALRRDEIAALAEQAHLDTCSATLLGEYLLHQPHGAARVHGMICADIRAALNAGDLTHARDLFAVLRRFLSDHPEAQRGVQ